MDEFTRLEGIAAYLPEPNIDTDIIYPARFLLLMERDGLGRHAFHDRRFARDGGALDDFILGQPAFAAARILIAGANFGCGSSREQAVWALSGFGIRCVIAPSFGEIFRANCGKNGVLAITLPPETVQVLGEASACAAPFTIDLKTQTISAPGGATIPFPVESDLKAALLAGWDATDRILNNDGARITAFEQRHRNAQPWLFARIPLNGDG